jgi:hypothetical protein
MQVSQTVYRCLKLYVGVSNRMHVSQTYASVSDCIQMSQIVCRRLKLYASA